MKIYRTLKIAVVCTIIMGAAVASNDANAQVANYKAYSLFVHSFAKYSQWPESAGSKNFQITILGKTKLTEELIKLSANKKIGNRSIQVNQINDIEDIGTPHIIFITDFRTASLNKVLARVKGEPTMIITERDGLTNKGAAVSFITTTGNKLKFQVNKETFDKAGIKVANSILSLAYKG